MINQEKIKLLLNRLNYDFNTFKIGHFIHHVEGYRQRKILTIPYPFSPGISGAWVPGKLIDFVFFQSQTHVMHQNHIILHELAHMLLDHPLHRIDQILPPELLKQLGIVQILSHRAIFGASKSVVLKIYMSRKRSIL